MSFDPKISGMPQPVVQQEMPQQAAPMPQAAGPASATNQAAQAVFAEVKEEKEAKKIEGPVFGRAATAGQPSLDFDHSTTATLKEICMAVFCCYCGPKPQESPRPSGPSARQPHPLERMPMASANAVFQYQQGHVPGAMNIVNQGRPVHVSEVAVTPPRMPLFNDGGPEGSSNV